MAPPPGPKAQQDAQGHHTICKKQPLRHLGQRGTDEGSTHRTSDMTQVGAWRDRQSPWRRWAGRKKRVTPAWTVQGSGASPGTSRPYSSTGGRACNLAPRQQGTPWEGPAVTGSTAEATGPTPSDQKEPHCPRTCRDLQAPRTACTTARMAASVQSRRLHASQASEQPWLASIRPLGKRSEEPQMG